MGSLGSSKTRFDSEAELKVSEESSIDSVVVRPKLKKERESRVVHTGTHSGVNRIKSRKNVPENMKENFQNES